MIEDDARADDVRAATVALGRAMSGNLPALPGRLATVAVRAARPHMWLRLQRDIESLENEVATLRSDQSNTSTAAGGVCPHCGQLL